MDSEVIKISIDSDEKIIELLNRMLALKTQNNKEVEATIASGKILTTTTFSTLEEGLVVYSDVIFQELETSREEVFNNPKLVQISEMFNNRGNGTTSDPLYGVLTQENIQEIDANFKRKIEKEIDFTNSIEVFAWLNDLKDYVNNSQIDLPLNNSNIDYVSYLINKLEENGYTEDITDIYNLNDYYRKLISYQLQELKKYGFFAYEYMVDYLEKISRKEDLPEVENLEELHARLNQLELDQSNLKRRLILLNSIQSGTRTKINDEFQTRKSFADRKKSLEEEISKEQNRVMNNNTVSLEEAQKTVERLNSFIQDEAVKNNPAMPMFNRALETHDKNDILQALEATKQLDDSHMYKKPLLDTLNAMLSTYYPEQRGTVTDAVKNFEEAQRTIERLNSFIQDEAVKNNPAMPMFNRALETHNPNDIKQALEAVKQLDNSHMYKGALSKALNALAEEYYPKEIANSLDKIERLNSFIQDETVKNNSAMPMFNKAVETYDQKDILQALEAVKQLDDNHMYKKPLLDALNAMNHNVQNIQLEDKIRKLTKSVNDTITQDSVMSQNTAVPLYMKAIESKNMKDISVALEALKAPENQNNILNKNMMDVLTTMIASSSPELVTLNQKYERLLREEQATINYANPLIEQTQQELDNINQQINDVKQQIENSRNNPNQTPNQGLNPNPYTQLPKNNYLPGSSSPDAMLPQKPLEDDYYKRLENAANEEPIFHDDDLDFDLTPKDDKPHIIKKITKAPSKLISHIKEARFGKIVSKIVDWMSRHKVATTIAGIALMGLVGASKIVAQGEENIEKNNDIVAEQRAKDNQKIANNNIASVAQEIGVNGINSIAEITNEKTEDEKFEESLQETLNDILGGNTKVYISSDRAINDVEAKQPTNLENSWENAVPGAYYNLVDGKPNQLTEEQAKEYWKDGGTVAVSWENNGTGIGWTSTSSSQNNLETDSGKSI